METTLTYVLSYIAQVEKSRASHGFKPASLLVLADNDYYSQPRQPDAAERPSSSSSASDGPAPARRGHGGSADISLGDPSVSPEGAQTEDPPRPRFRHFGTSLSGAHKTGLGSSAAIVTALTAALLSHYLDPRRFDLASDDGRRVLHNLAQVAHCSAQGKIGSGFDVASAVYGSCLYRRFSPDLLARLPGPGAPGFGPALAALVDDPAAWDCEIARDRVGLPPGLAVRMCDVDCGTQTVGMVKKVHEWRAREPDLAARAYDDLQRCVDELAAVLRENRTDRLAAALRPVRDGMRKLGRDSGAPIEPESQEAMLDALEKVPGVYGGVVPGAGGYDAAAVVMRDDDETERLVRRFLRKWSLEHGVRVRLMKVRGETEGVRREELDEFKTWILR